MGARISVGFCTVAMTCAIVNVLPEPVTPSRTWSLAPLSTPSISSSDRLRLVARGPVVRLELERDAGLRPLAPGELEQRVLGQRRAAGRPSRRRTVRASAVVPSQGATARASPPPPNFKPPPAAAGRDPKRQGVLATIFFSPQDCLTRDRIKAGRLEVLDSRFFLEMIAPWQTRDTGGVQGHDLEVRALAGSLPRDQRVLGLPM